jgi:hypothetical protein
VLSIISFKTNEITHEFNQKTDKEQRSDLQTRSLSSQQTQHQSNDVAVSTEKTLTTTASLSQLNNNVDNTPIKQEQEQEHEHEHEHEEKGDEEIPLSAMLTSSDEKCVVCNENLSNLPYLVRLLI